MLVLEDLGRGTGMRSMLMPVVFMMFMMRVVSTTTAMSFARRLLTCGGRNPTDRYLPYFGTGLQIAPLKLPGRSAAKV